MPARRGSGGRIPDNLRPDHELFARLQLTLPQELNRRLEKFCDDEERAKSWVTQKALDMWLEKKGY